VLLGHALQALALARADLDPGLARELFAAAIAECRRAGDLLFLLMALNNRSVLEWRPGYPAGARAMTEEMIALAEEVGYRWWLPILWEVLGEVLLLEGDADNAVPFLRRALVDGRRGDPRAVLGALQGLARCTAAVGDHARAAQLTGASDALDAAAAAHGPVLMHRHPSWALAMWEEHRERLRTVLGEEELERGLDLGGRMRLEQACDLALGRTMPG